MPAGAETTPYVQPAQMTELSKKGRSLQPVLVTLSAGVMTNVSDYLRPTNAAKVLNNLQQTQKRGVWSSRGIGWTRWRHAAYNAAKPFMGFDIYVDSTGSEALMMQVGDALINLVVGSDGKPLPASANAVLAQVIVSSEWATSFNGGKLSCHTTGDADIAITGDVVTGSGPFTHTLALGSNPSRTITTGDTVSVTMTLLTGLDQNSLPCIKNHQSSAAGTAPVSVYVNGNLQAAKQVTALGTASDLFLNGGAGPAFGATAAPLPVKTYKFPKFCQPFYNRMAYFGFSGNTDTSRDVVITNAGTNNTVTQSATLAATDGGIVQVAPRLGAFVGAFNLRISNTANDEVLIIGCTRGLAIITGTDATNFRSVILTREYGLLSNYGWVQLQNDVLFPSTNGIRRLSDLFVNATLINATLTLGLADLYSQINTAAAAKIHACHNPPTQEVQFWFPIQQVSSGASAVCQNAFVLNYNTQDNNPNLAPAWSTRDGTIVNCSIYFRGVFFGGGNDGLLQQHYSGNLYDTAVINWNYVGPLLGNGNPILSQSIRLISFITEGNSQKVEVSWYVYERMANGSMRRRQQINNFVIQALQTATTILGTWILGQGVLPVTHVKMLDFKPRGHFRFAEVQLSGIAADDAIDLIGYEIVYSVGGTRL